MPAGRSRDPTLRETWREALESDKLFFFGLVAAPLLVGAFIGHVFKYDADPGSQTPPQALEKAAQLWRDNGYEVTGLKSYEALTGQYRSVTQIIKGKADGKTYEGTAVCGKNCEIRNIASTPKETP